MNREFTTKDTKNTKAKTLPFLRALRVLRGESIRGSWSQCVSKYWKTLLPKNHSLRSSPLIPSGTMMDGSNEGEPTIDYIFPSWQQAMVIKTQVQIPDDLFRRAKDVAAAKEWSFAEIVRRGLEYMVSANPSGRTRSGAWKLPDPINLGLVTDPFSDETWREDANLSTRAAKMPGTFRPARRKGQR